MDHLCYLCLVFVVLSCLFIAALWSPAGKGRGKGLTFLLLFVMFNCVLSLSNVVSWVRCGTCLYRLSDLCCLSYFYKKKKSATS